MAKYKTINLRKVIKSPLRSVLSPLVTLPSKEVGGARVLAPRTLGQLIVAFRPALAAVENYGKTAGVILGRSSMLSIPHRGSARR